MIKEERYTMKNQLFFLFIFIISCLLFSERQVLACTDTITYTWQQDSGATSYHIWKQINDGSYFDFVDNLYPITSFTDHTLCPRNNYCYSVSQAIHGRYQPLEQERCFNDPLPGPVILSGVTKDYNAVNHKEILTWTAAEGWNGDGSNQNNNSSYKIYRCIGLNCTDFGYFYYTIPPITTFTDK